MGAANDDDRQVYPATRFFMAIVIVKGVFAGIVARLAGLTNLAVGCTTC